MFMFPLKNLARKGLNTNKSKPKRMASNSPYNSYADVLHLRWDENLSVWNF